MATVATATARPLLDADNPLGFFTNVASALLLDNSQRWLMENPSHFVATFNVTNAFGITNIPVLVGNRFVFTPAVHRLLQLAANVYEAASTNAYPSVFRPLFSRDANGLGTNLFISGFTNVASVTGPGDGQLSMPMDAAALAETNIPVVNLPVNVYGVPWIIGAKKGLPNFNEFAMESAFQLARKLQVTRDSTNDTYIANPSSYHFNQMFLLSLSNQVGVECWNSYTNDFTDPVTIYVTDKRIVTLTNDEGLSTNISVPLISGFLQIPNLASSNWPGYNPNSLSSRASFQIPLNTNITPLPPSIYRFNVGGLPYLTTNFFLPYENNVIINGTPYPQPHWRLATLNDVRIIMMDTAVSPYHIIDYVQLNGPNIVRDLSDEIMTNYDVPFNATEPSGSELWNTNVQIGVPIGIVSQIGVSEGIYTPGFANGTWGTTDPTQVADEIDGFLAFMGFTPPPPDSAGEAQAIALAETNLSMQAPYSPMATMIQVADWQVNDPLVHYLAEDIDQPGVEPSFRAPAPTTPMPSLTNSAYATIGELNTRYMPWGGHQPLNPQLQDFNTVNAYHLALKDPLLWNSDDWDFPTNEPLSGQWLGRVHRGTPWQTVYLKSPNILDQTNNSGTGIGTNTWMTWTGDTNEADAVAMAPMQDWHLASLLAYLMNTNDLQSRHSINSPNQNAWLELLNGLTASTNSLSDSQIIARVPPQFDPLVISSNSPQAAFIVNAIQSARAGQTRHFFCDVGDILAIPQLSEHSPFLNWNDATQQEYGISDEAYEIIPSQLLPLLRSDSVGSVASLNGHVIAEFSGYNNHTYAIEQSSNLVDWTSVSTNVAFNGGFSFTNSTSSDADPQFYRSALVR